MLKLPIIFILFKYGIIDFCLCVCKANHGGVRGKLPKENDDEEPVDETAYLNDSNDELIAAAPEDEVNHNNNNFFTENT